MQPLPLPTAIFQEIVIGGAQESGLLIVGDLPTSGSSVTATLRNVGRVSVILDRRVDDGTDSEGLAWSTWTWVPGSLRPIDEEVNVKQPEATWKVIRNQGNGTPLRRTLYAGDNEERARKIYEVWSVGIQRGSLQLIKAGTVISETRAPRRIL